MKTNRKLALVGAFALSLCLTSAAFADKTEPSAEDLKNSHERGLFIEPPVSPSANVIKSQPTEKKPAVKESKSPNKAEAKTEKKPTHTTTATKTQQNKTVKVAKIKVPRPMVAKVKPAAKTTSAVASGKTENHGSNIETVSFNQDTVIKAWLNKPGSSPKYRDGEKMEVNVTANQDCNITIFDYDGKGKLTQIFPNEFQKTGMVKSGETVTVGGADSSFDYQVSVGSNEKKVTERIFVFAYPIAEAPISIAMNTTSSSPFRSAEMTMEQYKKLVNESKVYFSREVKIVPKAHAAAGNAQIQNCSDNSSSAPNKVELCFSIEK